jgi:hypothetical protein
MLSDWGSDMARLGLGPSSHSETGCNYVGRYRSLWVYAVCVIFFPLGLLALLADKRREVVGVEFFDAGGDSGLRMCSSPLSAKGLAPGDGQSPPR